MADDSDYTVPCSCGGWLHFVDDVQQPHTHRQRTARQMLLDDLEMATGNANQAWNIFNIVATSAWANSLRSGQENYDLD